MISTDLVYKALKYYKKKGYTLLDVPLIVDEDIINLTIPLNMEALEHLGKFYVGSAEQSFLQLYKDGYKFNNKLYQAITPCHRDEVLDDLHYEIFLKIELFTIDKSWVNLCNDALNFFNKYITCFAEHTDIGCDIVTLDGTEIGSYGEREVVINGESLVYSYGTGLALPRFHQTLLK